MTASFTYWVLFSLESDTEELVLYLKEAVVDLNSLSMSVIAIDCPRFAGLDVLISTIAKRCPCLEA